MLGNGKHDSVQPSTGIFPRYRSLNFVFTAFYSSASTSTQTLVDTQMTTSNFKLSNTTLLTDDDSEDSQDCAQDDNDVVQDSSAFNREFKEYIPGEPDSDDDAQGLVPYLDSDNKSNVSTLTNSSLQPEEVSRHKEPVSESEF